MDKATLVIHPTDASTEFLNRIYLKKVQSGEWDEVSWWPGDRDSFKGYLDTYDRIIMMGHGTPQGLINVDNFYREAPVQPFYIIDDYFMGLLKEKETVSIWCHSDQFARRLKLPGFHTGMIISEVSEARWELGSTPLNAEETLDNMNLFADVVGKHIDNPDLLEMQRLIREQYNRDDPVSVFNRKNIIMLDADGNDLVAK